MSNTTRQNYIKEYILQTKRAQDWTLWNTYAFNLKIITKNFDQSEQFLWRFLQTVKSQWWDKSYFNSGQVFFLLIALY